MRTIAFLAAFLAGLQASAQPPAELRERWETEYVGNDANGDHVLGLWTFDGEKAVLDRSKHGRVGTLQDAKIEPEGRFGACLRTFRGWPVEDKRHRFLVPHDATLTPKGPFTVELWINADQSLLDYPDAFLVDKKYVADSDYQLILQRTDRNGLRTLQANLGFGTHSRSWHSEPLTVVPGNWYHLAFSYNAQGTGRFFVDGRLHGWQHVEGVSRVSGGTEPLVIGDRVGSYFHGFPGRIDQVRITAGAREFRPARLERITDRANYVRMEKEVAIRFRLSNLDHQDIQLASLTWTLGGLASPPVPIASLKSGAQMELTYPLDTSLRPDRYRLEAQLCWGTSPVVAVRDGFELRIVPRRIPGQMPVVMWGAGPSELERLKQIGFTHALGIGADYARIWDAGQPLELRDTEQVQAARRVLDEALIDGVSFAASLSPRQFLLGKKELQRVDASQHTYTNREDICCLFPQVRRFYRNVGESVAQTYGDLPAFNAALLNTEVRDAAQICFHAHDREACRAATGADIPPQAKTKWGVDYKQLDGFPADRVIPDDHPLYLFYSWYWKQGDGWNQLNSQLHHGLQTMNRPDFWTWHDPAARVASVYGSGGDVDVLSHWTYSYPDPIRIGVATDQLLAMTRGSERRQDVMKMTQIIWYRSQTAPQPKPSESGQAFQARWEREQPDAPFITIAPMHLREAFWTKIARPIQGIMYHGWQSLVPGDRPSGYRYTHAETQHELQRLIQTVVQPLGSTLRRIPGIESDVAFYESFAAQMFAGRGTYGWSGKWSGDAHLVAQWAGLQPEIVYDETILRHGLGAYKLLFMMDCDVITAQVARQIVQFQKHGGLVIGDENTTPAIKPDILLPIYQRTGKASDDKAALLEIASQLRRQLAPRYEKYIETDNAEIIPYRRRHADTDYVFLINDHRQYGHYVGHHGRVMENGLPSDVTITVRRPEAFVYDLVRHKEVAHQPVVGGQTIQMRLGPGAGRLLMITAQEIQRVQVQAPAKAKPGEAVHVGVHVLTASGDPVGAVIPIELTIEDPESRRAEYSGYWAAIDGRLDVPLDIAVNDPGGVWTITARELASGRSATVFMHVPSVDKQEPLRPIGKDAANPVQPDG